MAYQLAQPLFDKLDGVTKTFVTDIASNTISHIAPLITVALTISFLVYALLIMQGAIETPVADFMMKCIRISFIVSIALSAGFYQSNIAEIVTRTPDELATALISNKQAPDKAGNMIDASMEKGFNYAADAFDQASLYSVSSWSYPIIAAIIMIATGILCGVGLAVLLTVKVALTILAGLGPLFIAALLFEPTKRYFELWVGQVVNYALILVIYSAVFGFFIELLGDYASQGKIDGYQNMAYSVGGLVIITCCAVIVLLQIPSIASALSGGVSLSFSHKGKQAAKGAAAAYNGGKAVGGTVASGARAITGKFQGKK